MKSGTRRTTPSLSGLPTSEARPLSPSVISGRLRTSAG
jgi:hypothetical protein